MHLGLQNVIINSLKVSPVVRCQGRYNHIITDPRKILLCSLCIILAISVEEGK